MRRACLISDEATQFSPDCGAPELLHLREISLIGEYSTEVAPFEDDYYVAFFDKEGKRFDVSGKDGAFELLRDLSSLLGVSLVPKLLMETNFRSRILFPKFLEGELLFVEPESAKGVIRRVVELFSTQKHLLVLSEVAQRQLTGS